MAVLLALALAGCRGLIEIPPQATQVVAPAGADTTVINNGAETEVIEKQLPDRSCFVRARRFTGVVQMNCADVAREIRP